MEHRECVVEELLWLRRRRDDHVASLTLEGELDLSGVPRLEEAVAEALSEEVRELVVDLRDLGFLDSSGIHLLLELAERSRGDGFALSIVGARGAVLRALEVSGTIGALPLRAARPSEHFEH
jgi:anti-anti-sigma factor